jgi:hypothetical protein
VLQDFRVKDTKTANLGSGSAVGLGNKISQVDVSRATREIGWIWRSIDALAIQSRKQRDIIQI